MNDLSLAGVAKGQCALPINIRIAANIGIAADFSPPFTLSRQIPSFLSCLFDILIRLAVLGIFTSSAYPIIARTIFLERMNQGSRLSTKCSEELLGRLISDNICARYKLAAGFHHILGRQRGRRRKLGLLKKEDVRLKSKFKTTPENS